MREILLFDGRKTMVDDEDFDRFGHLRWRADRYGYVMRTVMVNGRKTTARLHREIAGNPPNLDVHHRDENPLNNQRSNFELKNRSTHSADHRKANWPRRGPFKGRPYKGVRWSKGAWQAQISVDGKTIHVGRFAKPELAARAYDAAVRRYRGSDAFVNFPELQESEA